VAFKRSKIFTASMAILFGSTILPNAHPHVFVEANMELVINDKKQFTELRHVWRFDELFSASLIIDFDTNGDNKLDETEMAEITKTVHSSIGEYDFYTALRAGTKVINFYEPEKLSAYMKNGQMIMFFSVEPENPHDFSAAPLRISASDTSYYVAFEFTEKNVILKENAESCKTKVTVPNYDELYASNSDTLTEAYFSNPENPELGDEFFSWAEITC
jgi:ABC-type uncharacterized transport system substrate-binding protein